MNRDRWEWMKMQAKQFAQDATFAIIGIIGLLFALFFVLAAVR
jgi:hypothetical protein